jgi:molybdopterin converting factor small subunit
MPNLVPVRVWLYGAFRKYGDGEELVVEMPEGSSVADLKQGLAAKLGELSPGFREHGLIEVSVIADESAILAPSTILSPGAALAILPPVCGG